MYSAVQYLFYVAVSALHYCSVMYCTPLYNIYFITVLTYTIVVYSTVLCTVLSVHFVVLYSAVHFSGFKPDILYTLSVRLCTLCMVAVHSNLCCVCTLCILLEREGSLLARIGFLYRSTNGGGGSGQCRYPPILCSNSVVRPSHRGTTC